MYLLFKSILKHRNAKIILIHELYIISYGNYGQTAGGNSAISRKIGFLSPNAIYIYPRDRDSAQSLMASIINNHGQANVLGNF